MANPFDQLEAQQTAQTSKTPATPLPKKGGNAFDQLELQEKEKGMTPPTPTETATMGGKELGRTLTDNADTIGGIAGFGAGTVLGIPTLGAATGAALGNATKHQIQESVYGEPKQEGTLQLPIVGDTHVPNAAATMLGAGATEALTQHFGPMITKGVMKIPGLMTDALEGAAPVKGLFPALPAVPESLAGSTRAAKTGVQTALGALDESMKAIPSNSGVYETGASVQEGLKAADGIWHREGGKLYDKAKAMIGDIEVPSKPLRDIGDQIASGNNPTLQHFPKTGGYVPKVQGILDDITGLGDKVPFQALDGFRKKLIEIANDRTDALAADQAKGIVSKLTGAITDAMEQGLGVGSKEHEAWKAARTYWKDSAEVFDHGIMEKAMKANPEDVVAMFRPDTGSTPASISEARRIRGGVLDFVEKNGTPEEIATARQTYGKFLDLFTKRNMLSNGGDLTELPKKMAGYKDILGTLYEGTPEGKAILGNLNTLSGSVEKAIAGIPIQKGAEDAVLAKTEVARNGMKNLMTVLAGYAGFKNGGATVGGMAGLAGRHAADMMMDQVLKSPTATKMLAKEVERTVARSYAGTAESIALEPIATLGDHESTWATKFIAALNQGSKYSGEIFNAARTVNLGNDVRKTLGDVPTRK